MTPSEQRHKRHWGLMTYPERLRHVGAMFELGDANDVVWHTSEAFKGHHKWYWMRWDG